MTKKESEHHLRDQNEPTNVFSVFPTQIQSHLTNDADILIQFI